MKNHKILAGYTSDCRYIFDHENQIFFGFNKSE